MVFAFLDTSPAGVLAGHTQVITKKHYSDITNCPEKDLKALIVAVKKIAIAVKKVSCAQGINVLQNNGRVAGQFVSHIHFHIIPRKQDDGIWFDTKRRNPAPMELVETAKAIKEELKKES